MSLVKGLKVFTVWSNTNTCSHKQTDTHTHTVLMMDGLFTVGVDLEDIGGGLLKHILQF